MRWQKRARVVIAIVAIAVAVAVAATFKSRQNSSTTVAVSGTDPHALVESTGGRVRRFTSGREDVRVEYERQLTYADGSTKLMGVTVTTENRGGGRSFTVKATEGEVGKDDSTVTMTGNVTLAASDGLTARTEHASYHDQDGTVRAAGPVEFGRGRMSGSGVGMTYDKKTDVLTIHSRALVRMAPDASGGGGTLVTSESASFDRLEKVVRFVGGVRVERSSQVTEADAAVANLTPDEQRIDTLDLHGHARITGSNAIPGGLQTLSGQNAVFKYGPDGQHVEKTSVEGDAVIGLAGEPGHQGRQIAATTIDIAFGPDGSTPTTLIARQAVQLTLPAEPGVPARTIRSASLDASGEPGQSLTKAQFSGQVEYHEKSATVDRTARSARLDVALKPAMSAIEQATFAGAARFTDAKIVGSAATLRYNVESGALELSGTEPAVVVPHVADEHIAVDATKIDVALAVPTLLASGNVKSVVQPSRDSGADQGTKLPSMLKQDQPVHVTAESLDYDGGVSRAVYKGGARLWQGETSIKAGTITLDDKAGDLSASGSVATTTMLEQVGKDKNRERVRSIGTSKNFSYEDEIRRATYTGDAHLVGPQSDMTAARIELYLRPSGDELERAEGYDDITLREQNRRTTGSRLTYTAADELYIVTGTPVVSVDECGRETKGQRLRFFKATDTIEVDGTQRMRTQTKGRGTCQE
jgi:LPS export ABC transporter protein LptC